MKNKIIVLIMVLVIVLAFCGCEMRQSDVVSYNLSMEADNFNDIRQLTVINCITGDVLFQMTGKMSFEVDTTESQLEIVVEIDENQYKKHFVGLSDNVSYVVEDITTDEVDKYNYTLNFNPNMWLPVEIETID